MTIKTLTKIIKNTERKRFTV